MTSRRPSALTVVPEAPADSLELGNYDETYLTCRNLGHVWRIQGWYRAVVEVKRRLFCDRCGMVRNDTWGLGGDRRSASYHQPEGYRLEHGGASALDVRVEVLRLATVYSTEAEMLASVTKGAPRGARAHA
jgi:hypothetical protein